MANNLRDLGGILKKSFLYLACIAVLFLASCGGTSPITVINLQPSEIKEPRIGEPYTEISIQKIHTSNCDGANPSTTVSRSLIQEQTTFFEVAVEAGGLIRGTPIPGALEAELEAKIKAALGSSLGNKYQQTISTVLETQSGQAWMHEIHWNETKVKGVIDAIYQDGTATIDFEKVVGIELYDRTSEAMSCDVESGPQQNSTTPTNNLSDDVQASSTPKVIVVTATEESSKVSNASSFPRAYNFDACAQPCNGSNASQNFAEGKTKIYVQWSYENIPTGADYERIWRMNGKEWIRYSCKWTGPENGHDSVELTEPYGLHSGTWEMVIYVNGDLIIREEIELLGDHTYWDPAGTVDKCYGLTD